MIGCDLSLIVMLLAGSSFFHKFFYFNFSIFSYSVVYSCVFLQLQELIIREFSFHQFNANLLWPGTFAFAEWLVQHRAWIEGKHIIELGRHVICFLLSFDCSILEL